jgi:hypothetical protein
MILPIGYDLIHNLYIRMSLPLRLANLFGVAAALGDEVLAVYPSVSIRCQSSPSCNFLNPIDAKGEN